MTDQITPERLSELEKLERAATPSKWIGKFLKDVYLPSGRGAHHIRGDNPGDENIAEIFYVQADKEAADAAEANLWLIVRLRNAAPQLFANIRELRAENKDLRKLTPSADKETWQHECGRLSNENSGLRIEMKQLKAQLVAEVSQAQHETFKAQEENAKLKLANNDLAAELEMSEAERHRLEEENEQLRKANAAIGSLLVGGAK